MMLGVTYHNLSSKDLNGSPKISFHLFSVCLIVGTSRYFRNQHMLVEGSFLPARHTVWVMSALLGAVVVIIFGVLLGLTGT